MLVRRITPRCAPEEHSNLFQSRALSAEAAGAAFALVLFSLFVLTPTGSADPEPAVPEISFMMASRGTVFGTESSEVFCVAHHADAAPLTYVWSSDGGTLLPGTDSAVWFAPEMPGNYTISVEVLDDAGSGATDNISITVAPNEAPVVTALAAEASTLLPNQSTTVRCEAHDSEGHTLSYDWMGPSGSLSGSGPEVTFTAPVRADRYHVAVTVTDELGASSSQVLELNVVCPEPPAITELLVWPSLPDYTKEDMRGGYRLLRGSLTQCELECVATPSEGVTYEWSCTEGTIEGAGPIILFIPPNATTEVVVTLRVSDACGQYAEASETFKVYQREPYSTEIVTNEVGCLRCLRGY